VEEEPRRDPWGRPIGVQKGKDVSSKIRVTLEDLYNGRTINAQVRRRVVCRGCRTNRASPRCEGCGPSCPAERKTVQKRMGNMIFNQEVQVPSEERCKEEATTLEAVVERGMPNGDPHPNPNPNPNPDPDPNPDPHQVWPRRVTSGAPSAYPPSPPARPIPATSICPPPAATSPSRTTSRSAPCSVGPMARTASTPRRCSPSQATLAPTPYP